MGFIMDGISSLIDKSKKKKYANKPEEWFYSYEGKMKLLDLLRSRYYDEECICFIKSYLESLPNIKQLYENGYYIQTYRVADKIRSMAFDMITDDLGVETKAPYYLSNLLDSSKNPYLFFIKNLNHSYCGQIVDLTESLIFEKCVDVNSDFLHAPSIYESENEDYVSENYQQLIYQRLKQYIQENKII